MGTRASYPQEVKLKVVEMKLQGILTKVILEELNIRNDTHVTSHISTNLDIPHFFALTGGMK
ncbi:hypothetical protein [Lysinibacillus fusiformis]|uniref:hypothetical protein n=1 Tax=Lysinibacillus fusiformis TaxID=28031 RepID=UPI00087FF237|nr:hypothetical protein [Lysinibacillus fusiformis]NOG30002.1 hypothetical protein [Lysinibacillus fusiformis]SCX68828.1 hypothetical protein SAMN02787108_04362 [Lysinibacillus fusiformis]SDB42406.1 hypothetical protein SAMN02787070_03113 [Lysinibacillus fusiformis]SFI59268.1 hypothetical protein SAMN02787080_03128 [Lysinibacillus fusiformis]SFT28386.1 hypothetical protein SAMN02787099_04307 [Lysinibacillus fusiformis]